MSIDAQALRSGLADERRELQAAIEDAEQSLAGGDDDGIRAGLELQRSQLRKIEHALERHAAGTWEQCQACGGRISAAQIRVLPTVTHCEDCAEEEVYWGDTLTIHLDELGLDEQ